ALDGLAVVTAKNGLATTPHHPQGDSPMDKNLLAFLQKTLGLSPDSTEAQCTAAATAALASLPENVLATLIAKDAEITSLKSKTAATPDPTLFVPMDVAKGLRQQVTSLSTKITALEGEKAGTAMQTDIDAALKDGRLPATGAAWASALATSNPEALRDFLRVAAPVTALTQQQSTTLKSGADSAALSSEDKYVCTQLGMLPEDFCKHKECK
ncbi:MAG: phage protease, partial [Desulfovibrionaceae bacterium]